MAWWITFHTFKVQTQALVIIHHPHVSTASFGFGNYSPSTHFNCLFEQGVRDLEGSTCSAASTLSLWVLHGRRGACSFYSKTNIVILTCTSDIAQVLTTATLIPNIFTLNLGN